MTDLNLYNGNDPLVVSPQTLIEIVKAIIASGREAEFLKGTEAFAQSIEVQPDLVNFVKTFLFDGQFHVSNSRMANIVGSPPGSTSCFPKGTFK